jgi:hypothetical protein
VTAAFFCSQRSSRPLARDELGLGLDETWERLKRRVRSVERAQTLPVRSVPIQFVAGTIRVAQIDAIERVVVSLLRGGRSGQFSFNPQGEVFATMTAGWNHDSPRVDVTGASRLFETLEPRVEAHRAGRGGRVTVGRDVVRCANCYGVLLALNKVPILEFEAPTGHCSRESG